MKLAWTTQKIGHPAQQPPQEPTYPTNQPNTPALLVAPTKYFDEEENAPSPSRTDVDTPAASSLWPQQENSSRNTEAEKIASDY